MAVYTTVSSVKGRAIVMLILPMLCVTFVPTTNTQRCIHQYASVLSKSSIQTEENVENLGALSMNVDELAKFVGGWGRARLAWDCYSIGVDPYLYFNNNHDVLIHDLLPTCRQTQRLGAGALQLLHDLYADYGGQVEGGVATLSHISRSSDDTTKLLLRLRDGLEVETVIIPWGGVRSTLCISSQVGCRQGCTFCATGRMGRLRNLSSDEILAQMFFAKKMCRLEKLPPIKNIVFMGMGEPADNADAVIRAATILTKRGLFQLSSSKVTISTVGPTPESFETLARAPCVLAWSVHAVNDDLRRTLVPTTRYRMKELREGLIQALLDRPQSEKRTCMLEVALMAGVNDSLDHADELSEFAIVIPKRVPGCKLVVNLIPYNPAGNKDIFQKPSPDAVRAFQERLWQRNVFAHIRTTRGDDEQSACGQLATSRRRNKSNIAPINKT